MIEALCYICDLQNKIIHAQSLRLEELGAVCMADEIAEVDKKLRYFIGSEEYPSLEEQQKLTSCAKLCYDVAAPSGAAKDKRALS